MTTQLKRGVFAAGFIVCGSVIAVWLCGGFKSGARNRANRRRTEQEQAAAYSLRPYTDPLPNEEFIPEPGEVITPDKALQYMLEGKFGRFSLPGIARPGAVPAAAAMISDDATVVGVGVGGRWRAYCISEMQTPQTHVINDVLGGMPVTVTFCDANNCARVLTDREKSNQPLDVGVGGFWHDGMLLHVEDQNFSQSSPEVPLYNLKFELTTWKEWKRAHPDTDICTKLEPVAIESKAADGRHQPDAPDGPKVLYGPVQPVP